MRYLISAVFAAALAALALGGPATPPAKAGSAKGRYVAYYFHGKFRCPTCLKIERLSEKSVRENYAEMLRKGALRWQAVNTDLPENSHFDKDFGLTAGALVFVREEGGRVARFRVVDGVWDWAGGPEDVFVQKVEGALAGFIAGQ